MENKKPVIRFSHRYPKLPDEIKTAVLLAVQETTKEHLPNSFLIFDSGYQENKELKFYPVPSGQVLLLVYWHKETETLFPTVRRWTYEKARYYRSLVCEEFDVVIAEEIKCKEFPLQPI
jgi:hypothetical protein